MYCLIIMFFPLLFICHLVFLDVLCLFTYTHINVQNLVNEPLNAFLLGMDQLKELIVLTIQHQKDFFISMDVTFHEDNFFYVESTLQGGMKLKCSIMMLVCSTSHIQKYFVKINYLVRITPQVLSQS
jgi:hypothetical protein